jgi:GAF domain
MRSAALRVTIGAVACITLAAAAAFIFRSEKQLVVQTSALRAFDQHAHDASDALADLRASQQAYVAAGQGVAFWMPKVAAIESTVTAAVDALKQSPSPAAATALDEASSTLTEFANIDKRARDYMKSGQTLMAADVIFSEGGDAAATAARQIETARLAEHQAQEVADAALREQEAMFAGGAAGLTALAMLLLIPVPRSAASTDTASRSGVLSLSTPARETPAAAPSAAAPAPPSGALLKAAANLATDLGRLRDVQDLNELLRRTAEMMDASGVMVWMGSTSGADLRAVLAHGYGPSVLARIPPVPQSDNNAAAAAYRTGTMQIVMSRPGGTSGAVVAPILTADGCIGALSAEIRGGGEASDSVQALATIVASHLASVVASAPAAVAEETPAPKAASQG